MPYIDNGGTKIYYETEGTGPPLFLHHGLTGSINSFRDNGYTETLKKKTQTHPNRRKRTRKKRQTLQPRIIQTQNPSNRHSLNTRHTKCGQNTFRWLLLGRKNRTSNSKIRSKTIQISDYWRYGSMGVRFT